MSRNHTSALWQYTLAAELSTLPLVTCSRKLLLNVFQAVSSTKVAIIIMVNVFHLMDYQVYIVLN